MSKTGKSKQSKPASAKGVPVLPILFSLLFLALTALGGWLYWSDLSKGTASQTTAVSEITPPVPAHESSKKAPPNTHAEEKSGEEHQKPTEETAPSSEASKEPARDHTEENLAEEQTEQQHSDTKPVKKPIGDHASKPAEEQHANKPIQPDAETLVKPAKEHPTHKAEEDTAKAPEHEPAAKQNHEEPATDLPAKTDPVEKPVVDKPEEKKAAEHAVEAKPKAKTIQPPKVEKPLAPVPDPELVRKSDFGLLPIVSPSGRQAWRTYARPFDDPLDRPRISIIISEMGMSPSATRSTIQNLPGAITLSFNPYARNLQSWAEQARAAGHEVLLQLPMEPFGYPKNDPGDHSLLTSLTDRENLNRLEWMLGRFTGYSGVTNQMGSKFTAATEDIKPILEVIKSRGLLFIDGRTSAKSVAGQLAGKTGIPVAINNRFLDHKADRATIDARLKDLERIARYTGTAVGIGYPYPVTLERINIWAQSLARKGIVLAPVSAAINRQEIR